MGAPPAPIDTVDPIEHHKSEQPDNFCFQDYSPLSVGSRRNDTGETEPNSRKPKSPAGPTPPNLRERSIETDWTFRPPALTAFYLPLPTIGRCRPWQSGPALKPLSMNREYVPKDLHVFPRHIGLIHPLLPPIHRNRIPRIRVATFITPWRLSFNIKKIHDYGRNKGSNTFLGGH